MDRDRSRHLWQVRVFRGNSDQVVGTGFLVDDRHVLSLRPTSVSLAIHTWGTPALDEVTVDFRLCLRLANEVPV